MTRPLLQVDAYLTPEQRPEGDALKAGAERANHAKADVAYDSPERRHSFAVAMTAKDVPAILRLM